MNLKGRFEDMMYEDINPISFLILMIITIMIIIFTMSFNIWRTVMFYIRGVS